MAHTAEHGKTCWLCLCLCGSPGCPIALMVRANSLLAQNVKGCQRARFRNRRLQLLGGMHRIQIANSNKRKVHNSLTFEEYVQLVSLACAYCGAEPRCLPWAVRRKLDIKTNGIDRVDNKIGYTRENCVPCCETCNFIKRHHNMSYLTEAMSRFLKVAPPKTFPVYFPLTGRTVDVLTGLDAPCVAPPIR